MKTISFLLLLGLVQAGLAQTAIVPVQPIKVVLSASFPQSYLNEMTYRIGHTVADGYELSVSDCCSESNIVYYIDVFRMPGTRRQFSRSIRKTQIVTGGLPAEFAPTPAPAKLFYPTLSQGRYAYH